MSRLRDFCLHILRKPSPLPYFNREKVLIDSILLFGNKNSIMKIWQFRKK